MKEITELMSIKLIPEIFDEVALCTTEDEITKVLQKNQSPALKLVLAYTFHPDIKFDITELPPYRPDVGEMGLSPGSLYTEMRRFYLFDKSKDLPLEKKTVLLARMLESMHPAESEFVGKILKRDLQIPLLSYDLVWYTFPGLLPDPFVVTG
jgi:hypothetical protein